MKFKDYKYERPSYEEVKESFSTLVCQINNAKGYEEQNKYIKELNNIRKNIETMSTIASIRNSINTADEFYDKEQNYWDEYGPLYTELNTDFHKAIVNSKFKEEIKKEYSEQFYKLCENSIKSFSTEIIPDLQEENKLMSQYTKLLASAKINFNNEELNLSGLYKYMLSDDRSVREKASKAYYNYFEEHEEEFDDKFIANAYEAIAIQRMLNRAEEIYKNHIEADFKEDENIVAETHSCAVRDYLVKILGSVQHGYSISDSILSAVEFGIPQKRKRFVLMGVQKKYTDKVEMPVPSKKIQPATVRDAIEDLEDVTPYFTVQEDEEKGGVRLQARSRDAVGKLNNLRDNDGIAYNHIIPQTTARVLKRFKVIKEGQNFHSLDKALVEDTYTDAKRTQNTIYLRLKYDEPSGTVVNVRKSMWIHPHKDRAISVREAARLQTFPDSFRFYGTKDSQYQQVGNAVPPMLARAIAEKLLSYIWEK